MSPNIKKIGTGIFGYYPSLILAFCRNFIVLGQPN